MEEQQKRWMAHVTGEPGEVSGMDVWCTWGVVTPDGQWVEQIYTRPPPLKDERVRHQLDAHWCETPTQAKAMKADKLERLGRRLIEQAAELRAAAEAERVAS